MASTQPNPSDLTNVLLLRLLQNNDSFGGSDPLAPVMNVSSNTVKAQSILFASLAVTLLTAFITILGRQWVLHYKETSDWGITTNDDAEHQMKLVGPQKQGLHFIMESLPLLLQLSLLLFGIGLTVYLWDLDLSSAEVTLAVACIEFVFYACTTVIATIWRGYPFQTPLSILLSIILCKAKRIRFAQLLALLKRRIFGLIQFAQLPALLKRQIFKFGLIPFILTKRRIFGLIRFAQLPALLKRQISGLIHRETIPGEGVEGVHNEHHRAKLSNPAFWRQDPLFTSPIPNDLFASVGAWLLDKPTDNLDSMFAAVTVAEEFPNLQWLSHPPSSESLTRLHLTYMSCFTAPRFDIPTRLKALQSAAAYYVLYHSRLIFEASKSRWVEEKKLPRYMPSDLLLTREHEEKWQGRDLFKYLLHIEDRSAPVTSARFLSYIAPYWFCGDSDSAIKSRSSRLPALRELINVLESSKELYLDTLTNCVLCVGAVMDFPLHPEDLIRVYKGYVSLFGALRAVLIRNRDHLLSTFEVVVEHIHQIILARSRHYDHTAQALEILLTLIIKCPRVPFLDAVWMNELLKRVAEDYTEGRMTEEHFTLFLKLSTGREASEDLMVDTGVGDFVLTDRFEPDRQPVRRTTPPQSPIPGDILFSEIIKYIQDRVKQDGGWQDDDGTIFGGLLTIRDIRKLEHPPFHDDVLQTLHDAMKEGNPPRVRQAAFYVMLVMQDRWLKSETLRQKLQDLYFLRRIYRAASVARPNPDYRLLFLKMTETLSEDVVWHPYLRGVMHIWLPLRHDGQDHTLRILVNVGALSPPTLDGHNSLSFDEFLQKLVVDEWTTVPGRQVHGLTADRLGPLAEITKGLKELLFDDDHRREVLAVVEQVIPGLERRHGSDYEGPGDDVRGIVGNLVTELGLQPEGLPPGWSQPEWLQPGGSPPGELRPGGSPPGELRPGGSPPGWSQPEWLQPEGLQPEGSQPEGLQPERLQPGRFPPEGLPSQRFLPGGSPARGLLPGGPPTTYTSTYD